MTDLDDQIAFHVDSATKEAAKEKLDYGELGEELRNRLREIAFGEDVAKLERIEKRIESVRDEIDDLSSRRQAIDREIDALRTEEAELEQRLDELESQDGS